MITYISTLIMPFLLQASVRCIEAFDKPILIKVSTIGLGQDRVGVEWSNSKNAEEIVRDYNMRRLSEPGLSKQQFLLDLTGVKPLTVYRDIDGALRLADGHHKFRGQALFMSPKKNYRIEARLLRDYTGINPKTGKRWTGKAMMRDLRQNKWVHLHRIKKPTVDDLRSLPRSILDLPDSPRRSVIGFLLRSFSEPLRGGDFTPMIQFRLAIKMESLGIDLVSKKPYSDKNLRRLRRVIADSPELKTFLLRRLNRMSQPERRRAVKEFLKGLSLETLDL